MTPDKDDPNGLYMVLLKDGYYSLAYMHPEAMKRGVPIEEFIEHLEYAVNHPDQHTEDLSVDA